MLFIFIIVSLLLQYSNCYSIKSLSLRSSSLSSSSSSLSSLYNNFDAILFDCDGVIAETERDVHRVGFNDAFKSKGLKDVWDVDLYGKLLKIGGGKERMTKYFNDVGWPLSLSNDDDKKKFIQDLHLYKTECFQVAVENGAAPLRPGVQRLIDDALKNGLKVAVCSTSNEAAVTTIVRTLLGPDRLKQMQIFAGDVVQKKKPSPDIYLLAAKTLSLDPNRCWVIEDSEIGLKAAKSAGMKCVVTKSVYTKEENFDNADVCINDLDHGLDGPITLNYLNYKASDKAYKAIKSVDNAEMFGASPDMKKMFSKIADGKGMPFGM